MMLCMLPRRQAEIGLYLKRDVWAKSFKNPMSIIITNNKKQTIVLKRWAWSIALYAVIFCLGFVAVMNGLVQISFKNYLLIIFFIIFFQAFVYWAIRSGYYERWDEASFLYYEILIPFLILILFLFLVEDFVRPTVVNISLLGALFGIFALKRIHFVILAGIIIFAFGITTIADFMRGELTLNPKTIVFQWVITVIIIIFFSFVGDYVSAMRNRLRTHRDILKRGNQELVIAHRELKSALRQMSEKAVRDELTGLYNRHQFSETLYAQIAVAQGTGAPLGLLIIDVDHFKQVNDIYGHLAGDEILKTFSQIPENCLRKADFIARYGGEEFVALLPNTDHITLKEVAERIRTFIESLVFDDIAPGFGVTISIGATHFHAFETAEKMMERADKALYQAKNQGRNVFVYNI